jgi:hypothetical protein
VHRLAWAPSASFTVTSEVDGDGGSAEVAMVFENAAEARWFPLGLACEAEVLDPPALREDLRAAGARIAGLHG